MNSFIDFTQVEMDPDTGAPMEELTVQTKASCKELGLDVTNVNEIAPDVPEILDKAIKDGIARANTHAVSNAAKVSIDCMNQIHS